MAYSETPTPTGERARKPAWRRYGGILLRRLSRGIDHNEVVEHVREEGHLSGRYLFMTVMSCAVATLGLLLSSPAVIIGAMLISPLMGPIMLMGFSLPILEWPSLRRAVFAQVCGVAAALAIAFIIVFFSPLKESTPEIVARTRPNLFDLLVAVFSGLAGGYAVIHRKGETIVGVAIATALMPPLAVTGYGLAIGAWDVAGGAFFLFMTNLLAIAFCVVGLSKLYGFGEEHSPRHTLWQSIMILVVFAALSVPLGIALRDIAYETAVTNQVRTRILEPFPANDARVADFSVAFPRGGDIRVAATVMTHEPVPEAEDWLQAELSSRFDRTVAVELDQVIMNEDRSLEAAELLELADNSLAAPLRAEIRRVEELARSRQANVALRNAVPFPVKAAEINSEARRGVFVAAPSPAFGLAAFREVEANLQANYEGWDISVIPPVGPLPMIEFAPGSRELSENAREALALSLWALERWQADTLEVVGHVAAGGPSSADRQRLSERAATIIAYAASEGFAASEAGDHVALSEGANLDRVRSLQLRPGSMRRL